MSDKAAQLLVEIEQLLRTKPKDEWATRTPEGLEWLGRAQAAMNSWDSTNASLFRLTTSHLQATSHASDLLAPGNWAQLLTMLYEARSELRRQVAPPVAEVFDGGRPFDYFDEVRKMIELARADLLFVDPYLDADFVSRFLPYALRPGIAARLLTFQYVTTLLPAVELFSKQHSLAISVRSDRTLHDRLLFIDGRECYFSGGSFKDGATKSPIILMQIMDAFDAVKQVYEGKWAAAKVERP